MVEVHRPDAVGDLRQGDVLVDQRVADEQLVALEADGPGPADAADVPVPRIVGRWQPGGQWPGRRGVAGGRRLLAERLVRPLLVELVAEAVEAPLLGGVVPARRSGGLGLERPVHSLMAAVLLGATRLDALVGDAQL